MTQTPHYKLTQWDKTDRILMEPFNQDHAKIDTALKAHDTAIAAKAQQSDLTAEISARTKALAAETAARTSAISALNTAVAKLGNCQLYTTTYTGPGGAGESGAVQLTFPGKPELVAVADPGSGAFILMIQGCRYTQRSNSTSSINVTWSGNSVRWYNNDGSHFNKNYSYPVVALISAG